MEAVSIYELPDGDIEVQFTDEADCMRHATRILTTQVEGTTMDILRYADLPRVKQVARRILNDFSNVSLQKM